MRERGLAASGGAGDDVERVLRQAAAEDLIKTGHAGGHFPDCYPFLSLNLSVAHQKSPDSPLVPRDGSGHASPIRRSAMDAPMKGTTNRRRCAVTAITAAAPVP